LYLDKKNLDAKMILIVIEGDFETLEKINASLSQGIRVLVLAVRIFPIILFEN
jgi:hypothetical protein